MVVHAENTLHTTTASDVQIWRGCITSRSQKSQLLVLGMHRSGTSALTGLLELCGAFVGHSDELLLQNAFNEKGYFERKDVYELHERILEEAEAAWYDVSRVAATVEGASVEYEKAIVKIVGLMDEHPPWVLKDPRMCVLLNLWKKYLRKAVCVLVYREPLAVAQSLRRRDGLSIPHGIALWEYSTVCALNASRDMPRVLISYDELVRSPAQTAKMLVLALRDLGCDRLRAPPDSDIDAFISPSLRHHRSTETEWNDNLAAGHKELLGSLRDGSALRWEEARTVSSISVKTLDDLGQARRYAEDQSRQLLLLEDELARLKEEKMQEVAAHEASVRVVETKTEENRQSALALEEMTRELALQRSRTAALQSQLETRDRAIATVSEELTATTARVSALNIARADSDREANVQRSNATKLACQLGLVSRERRQIRLAAKRSGAAAVASVGSELRKSLSLLGDRRERLRRDVSKLLRCELAPGTLSELDRLIDSAYYLRTNPDVVATGVLPLIHYMTQGAKEDRRPNTLFDPSHYRQSGFAEWGAVNPLFHYIEEGAWQGRDPHPLFSTGYYLRENVDVAVSGMNPLAHFLECGGKEQRKPHPLFDTEFYLRENPDVARTGVNPLVHFVERGCWEGRDPNSLFDVRGYIRQNPETTRQGVNPLEHYVIHNAEMYAPIYSGFSVRD